MYDIDNISPETQVLLLLCGSLGKDREQEKPLTPSEFYQLAQWMKQNNLNPPDLVTPHGFKLLQDMRHPKLDSGRIITLLERGGSLALSLEDWGNRGIWVLSRYDISYPGRLAERLGKSAPLLLYGVGDGDLLQVGGLAIIGSRDVDASGIEFTRKIADISARQDIQVISGGARGVDTEAMLAALESGGRAIGILADSLVKTAVSGKFRRGIIEGNLLLVSSYDPYAGFSIGSAMGRNKYIYGLSNWSLVISTSSGTGGTWSGALENLKNNWSPLFVRTGSSIPQGNKDLIAAGGIALDESLFAGDDVDLRMWLDDHKGESTNRSVGEQLSLLE